MFRFGIRIVTFKVMCYCFVLIVRSRLETERERIVTLYSLQALSTSCTCSQTFWYFRLSAEHCLSSSTISASFSRIRASACERISSSSILALSNSPRNSSSLLICVLLAAIRVVVVVRRISSLLLSSSSSSLRANSCSIDCFVVYKRSSSISVSSVSSFFWVSLYSGCCLLYQ